MTKFFKGHVNPSEWRPLHSNEPGYGSRQYVRKNAVKVTKGTPRISLRKFQTITSGRTLEDRARANPRHRTPEQKEKYATKRRETAAEKKKYGRDVRIKEIRKLKNMTGKKAEKLSEAERRRLGFLAHQNNEDGKHDAFLDWIGSPTGKVKKTKKSSRSRMSKERIMRGADRSARKKAA
jgi:hypothetical protein